MIVAISRARPLKRKTRLKSAWIKLPRSSKTADTEILDRARYRYQQFCSDIAGQDICQRLRLERNELIFNDYTTLIAAWLSENAWWDGEEERSTS